jgi:hypothetical protein
MQFKDLNFSDQKIESPYLFEKESNNPYSIFENANMMPRISNNGVLSPLKSDRFSRKSNFFLPTQRYAP